jgi:hypothetical protein
MRKFFLLPFIAMALSGCGYNGAVSDEAGIKAAWEDNMNVRDSMVKQISEAMHIAETDRASLAEAIEGYMSAQNPEEGAGQLMRWTQNAGVQITSENFGRVIDIMEAKRNEFQNANTRLRDKQRAYETSLGALPNGPILGLLGFPKALPTCDFSLSDPYCPSIDKDHDGVATVLDFPVIVSGGSKVVFASGQDDWQLGGGEY